MIHPANHIPARSEVKLSPRDEMRRVIPFAFDNSARTWVLDRPDSASDVCMEIMLANGGLRFS